MDITQTQQTDTKVVSPQALKEYDGHEFLMSLNDEASGLEAYVAIHNTNLGPALGGTRMIHYASSQDAVRDVLNLSKAMSYKCALANLPYGGGKAVIILDDQKDRDAVLLSYGRLVEKLRGLFKTGTDVGITDGDVQKMATQTSHMLGVTEADRGNMSTSSVAALGVFYAMKSALRQLQGNSEFHGVSVAIKGVGKLGGELARLVIEAGGKVCVADVDMEKCARLQEQWSDLSVVPVEDIHRQQATIYAPCALGNEFSADTVAELQCKAVVGGANNQLSDPQIGDVLKSKDILYAPDYIANAGGLIYVADELEDGGFNKERVVARTQAIEQTMDLIFQQAQERGMATNHVADAIALERIQGVHHE